MAGNIFRGRELLHTESLQRFYEKSSGEIKLHLPTGYANVVSPISGETLLAPHEPHKYLRDPITGTRLRIKGGKVHVTAFSTKQQLLRSKQFRLVTDTDVLVQEIRNTTYTNACTNEKVGTAGSSTGVDPVLVMRMTQHT